MSSIIEAALPAAVAEFKKEYPDGDFSFSLHVDIVSDRNAKHPVTVTNQAGSDTDAAKTPDAKADPAKKAAQTTAAPAK